MAVESPLLHLGWMTLSTLDDARRSSITGTTLNGPNGSGQFFWVYTSTINGLQVRLGSTAIAGNVGSSLTQCLGILQNTPGPGEAADIGFLGVSKVIAASTSITNGVTLAPSSGANQQGQVTVWQSGSNGPPIGYALETPTSSGAIFSAMIFASGMRST